MSTLKSKHVELLWLGTVIFLVLFARTYSVHANPDAAEEAMSTIRPEAIRADMRFLSDDALEGRGTGRAATISRRSSWPVNSSCWGCSLRETTAHTFKACHYVWRRLTK
jgi:hypothetical protein